MPYRVISGRLWDLLLAWLERRTVYGCPRPRRFPEVSYRWRLEKGYLVGEPGFCLISGARPPEPGILDEVGMAFLSLPEWAQACILAAVEHQREPWLRGKRWRAWLRHMDLTPRQYERLLTDAWRSLREKARCRKIAA